MSNMLKSTYYRLIQKLDFENHRFLYDTFGISERLTGLTGPRGVGKTTLLLQYIKDNIDNRNNVFYFSADHIYFADETLYKFVQDLYEIDGIRLVFIDEIHRYSNWNQELKNIYDSFPDLKIVFTGSSSLDLIEGSHDLSRRAVLYRLPGMSFREYLYFAIDKKFPVVTWESLLSDHNAIAMELSGVPRIKGLFRTYLKEGFYPFIFEGQKSYFDKIIRILDKTIFEDISRLFSLKSPNLELFRKLLSYLAFIPPGTANMNNLAKHLCIDNKTVSFYISILNKTGLVRLLYSYSSGSAYIRKPAKIYLDNTNLLFALSYATGRNVNEGNVRELFFLNSIQQAGVTVGYSKNRADFTIDGMDFEIGGPSKSRRQLSSPVPGFLVKDGILHGGNGIIPLYLFGFLY